LILSSKVALGAAAGVEPGGAAGGATGATMVGNQVTANLDDEFTLTPEDHKSVDMVLIGPQNP
jgi:hypothetical protein